VVGYPEDTRSFAWPVLFLTSDYTLEQHDDAFPMLDQAYQEHDIMLLALKEDHWMVNLHSDPRYEALLHRIGLPT